MKKMIVFALMSLVTVAASANRGFGPDQEYPIFSCIQTPAIPDNTVSLEVITGGFAGLTRIKLSVSTIAGPRSQSFYVNKADKVNTPEGHIIYVGKDLSLDISSDKNADGTRAATLTSQNGSNAQPVQLSCVQHARVF